MSKCFSGLTIILSSKRSPLRTLSVKVGTFTFSYPCFIYLHLNVNKLNTNLEVRTLYGSGINIILRLISILDPEILGFYLLN